MKYVILNFDYVVNFSDSDPAISALLQCQSCLCIFVIIAFKIEQNFYNSEVSYNLTCREQTDFHKV